MNSIERAEREGRLHAACDHPAPAGYSPEEIAAYERGRELGLAEYAASERGRLAARY